MEHEALLKLAKRLEDEGVTGSGPAVLNASCLAQGYLALSAKLEAAEQERNAAWFAIEHGWDIEPRAYFEKEAPTNGFGHALAQAVHHMWKRELKGRDGQPLSCRKCSLFEAQLAAVTKEKDALRSALTRYAKCDLDCTRQLCKGSCSCGCCRLVDEGGLLDDSAAASHGEVVTPQEPMRLRTASESLGWMDSEGPLTVVPSVPPAHGEVVTACPQCEVLLPGHSRRQCLSEAVVTYQRDGVAVQVCDDCATALARLNWQRVNGPEGQP